MFQLWQRGGELASIHIQPLLASWESGTDPAQIRLQAYLDKVESHLRPKVTRERDYYLLIEVGLPEQADILRHHDLENYCPVSDFLRQSEI